MRKVLFMLIITVAIESAIALAIGNALVSLELPIAWAYSYGVIVGLIVAVVDMVAVVIVVGLPVNRDKPDRYRKAYYFNPDPTNTQPTPPRINVERSPGIWQGREVSAEEYERLQQEWLDYHKVGKKP